MRKKILTAFLAASFTISLCACGSSGNSSTPAPAMEEMPTEETSAQDDSSQTSNLAGSANEALPEGPCLEGYSADELLDRLSSGEITIADIELNVATGDISCEVYEECLSLISGDLELDTDQSETASENVGVTSNIDASSFLTTYVVEFEDLDGYEMRETIQISPIFTEDDMETVYALWETLGNDASSFPSEDSLYSKSYLLRNMRDTGELEYIVGTYAIENLTDGFPITSDNPRNYNGTLYTRHVSAFDEEHDGTASDLLNMHTVSMVMYSDGATYYGEKNASVISMARMYSNVWGPCAFVVALPNMSTPNRPDGYRYDKTLILSTGMRFTDKYDPITLKYYTKEVE